MNKERIYLDNAETTNLSAEVLNEMMPVLTNTFGNTTSNHSFGRDSLNIVNKARNIIAETINAKANEVYFTSSGSEANSWAIFGIAYANRSKGNHIVVSKIEHPSIIEACKYLENDGFEVTYIDVDRNGFIKFADYLRALKTNTILVSIQSANMEIGTIQNIKAISQTAHEKGIIFHTDATQLYGNMILDVEELGIDVMSISSHKIHGPKGVGALYVSNNIKIDPIIFGGNQERHKRGGTANIDGIVGFGKACEIAERDMKTNNHKIRGLSDYFTTKLISSIEHVKFNVETKQKLPQIISVNFIGVNGESLMTKLDINGIAVSASCYKNEVSSVLSAIGVDNDNASCSIRFSFGKNNSYEEIDKAIAIIINCVEELRSYSSTYGMKTRKRKGDK